MRTGKSARSVLHWQNMPGEGTLDELAPLVGNPSTLIIASGTGRDLIESRFPLSRASLLLVPSGEPKFESLRALGAVELSNAEVVIAVGGGSVIDSAKFLIALSQFPEKLSPQRAERFSSFAIASISSGKPLIAIPTTVGSGAEVSSSAIVELGGRKVPVHGSALIPTAYILDPNLISNKGGDVAIGMLDMLGHAVESLFSRHRSRHFDFQSASVCRTVIELSKFDSLDESQMRCLQAASAVAGVLQDVRLVSIPHALAHSFPEGPHGLRVGVFLGQFLRKLPTVLPEEADRLNNILELRGVTRVNVLEAIDALTARTFRQKKTLGKATALELAGVSINPVLKRSSIDVSEELLGRFEFLVEEVRD